MRMIQTPLKFSIKQIDYIVMLIIKIIYHLHVFSENDIYELITIYNSDIANVTNEKIKKYTK